MAEPDLLLQEPYLLILVEKDNIYGLAIRAGDGTLTGFKFFETVVIVLT